MPTTNHARWMLIYNSLYGHWDATFIDIIWRIDWTTEQWNEDAQATTCETAQCPYCHETFTAPPQHDPLKYHIDYCPARPTEDE